MIFEITIQHKTDEKGWPIVVEQNQLEDSLPIRKNGLLRLNITELQSQPTRLDYGTFLGKALFQEEIRDAFIHALADSNDKLRVLLFVEADDLKSLHWERLSAPLDGKWQFLLADQRLLYSLYLPSVTDRRFPPIGRRDLRALLLIANPPGLEQYSLPPFDEATLVANIRTNLGKIPCDVLGTVADAVGPPTLNALCEQITAQPYTLLHIVSHGKYVQRRGETVLYWAKSKDEIDDEQNQVDLVFTTRLIERLGKLQGAKGLPHFVFLGACESAVSNGENSLGGLGQRLVQELGMPAVLAMTEPISMKTAEVLEGKFYQRLWEHGQVDLALAEALAGLAERHDMAVLALYSRLGNRPLFSDKLDRELTNQEIAFGLTKLESFLAVRAPVLATHFSEHAGILRNYLNIEPTALSKESRAERANALIEINNLCEEIIDLSFNALSVGEEPTPYDARCPFRGLESFRQENQEFFFGREDLIKRLTQRLNNQNFLAVLGPSGSGKSSVVLAGVIPALQKQYPDLKMTTMTPGNDPVANMATALARLQSTSQLPATLEVAGITQHLSDGQIPTTVLVVDQFEEVFTLCDKQNQRELFFERLLDIDDNFEKFQNIRVIVTMRADFWGECATYPALKEAMQGNQELIGAMTTVELRSTIEQQARQVGLRFETNLSQTILDEIQGEPGAMPLLQHALLELWQRRHGRWLRIEEYQAIGGVRQAIAGTADKIYLILKPADQVRMRNIFVRLTRLDEEASSGEERRDTRRRVYFYELVTVGTEPILVERLVQQLADSRLVVTSINSVSGQEQVEVSHESLIRYWPRLRGWLDEDRERLRTRQAINRLAQEWNASDRQDNLLPHANSKLEEAVAAAAELGLNELEQTFLDACVVAWNREKEEKEAQHRKELEAAQKLADERKQRLEVQEKAAASLRKFNLALSVVGFIAVVLAIMAGVFGIIAKQSEILARESARVAQEAKTKAIDERNKAELSMRKAQSNQLAAAAQNLLFTDEDPSGSLPLMLARQAILSTWLTDTEIITQPFVTAAADVTLLNAINRASSWRMTLPNHYHADWIRQAVFSPDGQTIATASDDQTARLWDVKTGKELCHFEGHEGRVLSVAFSPDGKTMATGGEDKTIRLWNIETGQEIRQFIGHTDWVRSVVFSKNGKEILSVSNDRMAYLWNVETGQQIRQFKGHADRVLAVAFSPNGRNIATASGDKSVRLWDIETGKEIRRFTGHTDRVWAVAFSPDGKMIATGSGDKTVRLWDTESAAKLYQISTHVDRVYALAFSPDGRNLATAGGDKIVYTWRIEPANLSKPIQKVNEFVGHQGWIWSVAFSPDGKNIVTVGNDPPARLWDVATGHEISWNEGHVGRINTLAFSPDGKTMVTGGEDQTVRFWDVATGQKTRQFVDGHTKSVLSVVFSPDGKTVATASQDGSVLLWDVATGRKIRRFEGHVGGVWVVAFSPGTLWKPGGKTIATAGVDKTIRLWNVETGEEIRRFLGHENSILSLAFSPEGSMIVTGSDDRTALLWNVETGQEIRKFDDFARSVWAVAFSPDGETIATASADQTARLWDVETGKEQSWFEGASGEWVAFSPDGSTLAVTNEDQSVSLYDIESRAEINRLRGHQGLVLVVAFSPDGKTIATTSADQTIRLWDVKENPQIRCFKHKSGVNSAVFRPNGKEIATASKDKIVRLWNIEEGEEVRRFEGHTESVLSVAFSPNGKMMASAGEDKTAQLWDVETGDEIHQFVGHSASVRSVAFSPNNLNMVTASEDKTAILWDIRTGGEIRRFEGHTDWVLAVVFSPNGKMVATAGADQIACLWNVDTGEKIRCFEGHTHYVNSVAFSPDGKTIATGSYDYTARLWDVESGVEIRQFIGHTNVIFSVAFSPDGKSIVTTSEDKTVRLWDVETAKEIRHLKGHTDSIMSVAFSPDGRTVVTVSLDGTARLWPVSIEDTLTLADSLIQRERPVFTYREREEFGLIGK